ncbi:MAG: beta-propeller fold lactonase family protein [Nitrospirae bacterium]|nr:beta-propeller fold lactonase family protein [Candidatus Manganitrophaceae bacterium]
MLKRSRFTFIVLLSILFLCFSNCGSGRDRPNLGNGAPASLSVKPTTARLHPGESQHFIAQVSESAEANVVWNIAEGPAGGSIQSDGSYTAPGSAGTYHLIATLVSDPTQSVTATITVVPLAMAPRFAYAVNSISNDVSIYTVDPTTGLLTKVGSMAAGDQPYTVTADPSGRFVYAGNFGSNNISMYTVDAATGLLTSTGTVETGTGPYSIAVDPAGKYAYVANENSSPEVWIYKIDPTAGVLTPQGQVNAGTSAICVTVDPLGRFVYVANTSSNNISVYTLNAATGLLNPITEAAAGAGANSVAVHPAGRWAYVANYLSNDVWWYQVDPNTGALTKMGEIGAGEKPFSIAIDLSGKFAYVANSGSNDISMYRIDPESGALTALGTVGGEINRSEHWGPRSVSVDPSGKFVYVANLDSNNLSEYQINSDTGQLIPIGNIGAGTQTRAVRVIGGMR